MTLKIGDAVIISGAYKCGCVPRHLASFGKQRIIRALRSAEGHTNKCRAGHTWVLPETELVAYFQEGGRAPVYRLTLVKAKAKNDRRLLLL